MGRTRAWSRLGLCFLLALAAFATLHEARAQDDPPPAGPPRPPAPPAEEQESSPPLEGAPPRPLEAPLRDVEPPLAPRFGSAGVVVVSDGVSISASTVRYGSSNAAGDSLTLTPGFDAFVVKGFTIGLEATAAFARTRSYGADGSLVQATTTTFGGGPRFGVNLRISRRVSLFPRLTLAIASEHHEQHVVSGQSASTSSSPLGVPSTTQTGPTVNLFVPLLLHPAPHFFVGFGPDLFHEFGRAGGSADVGGERTTIGGRFVIGTWWGGTVEGPASDAPSPPPGSKTEPRFGDARQVVLTGETGIGVHETVYGGTDSHTTTISISPGVDYFVASGFSLGVSVAAQWADQTGLEPGGAAVHYRYASYTLQPRVGFDFPLGSWLSLYPRIGVGGGVRSYDESAGASRNEYETVLFFVNAYVPIVFPIAPHAFFGFGPSFAHDLINQRTDQPSAYKANNLATTVGAGFIVGGWL